MENCDSNHSHTTTDWTISEVEFFVFFGRRVHVTVCYICWAHICWGIGTNHYTRYTRLHCMVYGYSCSHVLVSQLTKVSVESKVINKSRGLMRRWLWLSSIRLLVSSIYYAPGNGQLVSRFWFCARPPPPPPPSLRYLIDTRTLNIILYSPQ